MNLQSETFELFESVIANSRGGVALDIGANTGGYSERLLGLGWEVWAVEPVADVRGQMRLRLGSNPNFHVVPFGISDREEIIKDVNIQSCWTLVPDGSGLDRSIEYTGKKPFDLVCTTIDYLCSGGKDHNFHVGFIKLDVDGYELKALRGGIKTIQACRPPIMCEFNCYINKLGQSPEEFIRLITETLNYRIVSMDGKVEARTWEEVAPCWPYHSSYDVMLMPN